MWKTIRIRKETYDRLSNKLGKTADEKINTILSRCDQSTDVTNNTPICDQNRGKCDQGNKQDVTNVYTPDEAEEDFIDQFNKTEFESDKQVLLNKAKQQGINIDKLISNKLIKI